MLRKGSKGHACKKEGLYGYNDIALLIDISLAHLLLMAKLSTSPM